MAQWNSEYPPVLHIPVTFFVGAHKRIFQCNPGEGFRKDLITGSPLVAGADYSFVVLLHSSFRLVNYIMAL